MSAAIGAMTGYLVEGRYKLLRIGQGRRTPQNTRACSFAVLVPCTLSTEGDPGTIWITLVDAEDHLFARDKLEARA